MSDDDELNLDERHYLIVRAGDCEFWGECSCGKRFGMTKPDQSLDVFGLRWERHVLGGEAT